MARSLADGLQDAGSRRLGNHCDTRVHTFELHSNPGQLTDDIRPQVGGDLHGVLLVGTSGQLGLQKQLIARNASESLESALDEQDGFLVDQFER